MKTVNGVVKFSNKDVGRQFLYCGKKVKVIYVEARKTLISKEIDDDFGWMCDFHRKLPEIEIITNFYKNAEDIDNRMFYWLPNMFDCPNRYIIEYAGYDHKPKYIDRKLFKFPYKEDIE